MDKQDVAYFLKRCFKALRIAGGKTPDAELYAIYAFALKDLEINWVDALHRVITQLEEIPSPAGLRAFISGIPLLSNKEKGVQLLTQLRTALKSFGHLSALEAKKQCSTSVWHFSSVLGGWEQCRKLDFRPTSIEYPRLRDEAIIIAVKLSTDKEALLAIENSIRKEVVLAEYTLAASTPEKKEPSTPSEDFEKKLKENLAKVYKKI